MSAAEMLAARKEQLMHDLHKLERQVCASEGRGAAEGAAERAAAKGGGTANAQSLCVARLHALPKFHPARRHARTHTIRSACV